MDQAINYIKEAYDLNVTDSDDIENVNKFIKNMKQIMELEGIGRKKIVKELSQTTLLKNTIK